MAEKRLIDANTLKAKAFADEVIDGFDRKKYGASVLKIDLNTKEIISEYSSISEATRENNMKTSSNIRAVCKGLRNHAGGYGWRYREEVMKCSR